jgi:uncharacterized protein (DUF1330 family)
MQAIRMVTPRNISPRRGEIIKAHGGRLIAVGGAAGSGAQVIAVDGEAPKRVVIYQYPSVDAVRAWRNDPAYEEVRKIGEKYAKYRTFALRYFSSVSPRAQLGLLLPGLRWAPA